MRRLKQGGSVTPLAQAPTHARNDNAAPWLALAGSVGGSQRGLSYHPIAYLGYPQCLRFLVLPPGQIVSAMDSAAVRS